MDFNPLLFKIVSCWGVVPAGVPLVLTLLHCFSIQINRFITYHLDLAFEK